MIDLLPSNDGNNRNPLPLDGEGPLPRRGEENFGDVLRSFSRLLIPNAKLDN
jgi:hypothetical protein